MHAKVSTNCTAANSPVTLTLSDLLTPPLPCCPGEFTRWARGPTAPSAEGCGTTRAPPAPRAARCSAPRGSDEATGARVGEVQPRGANPHHSTVPAAGAAPGRLHSQGQRFLLGHSSDSGRRRADFVGRSEGRLILERDRAPGRDLPRSHEAPASSRAGQSCRHLRATAHFSRAHPGAHRRHPQRAESWTTAGRARGANVPPAIQ